MTGPYPSDRNDRSSWRRTVIWSGSIVISFIVLHWSSSVLAGNLIRDRLERFAKQGCSIIQEHPSPVISIEWFERRVLITGLNFVPNDACHAASMNFSGAVDTVELRGISLTGLFFRRQVVVEDFRLATTGLIMRGLDGSTEQDLSAEHSNVDEPWSMEIGNLHVHLRSTTYITSTGDTMTSRGKGIRAVGQEYVSGAHWQGRAAFHRVKNVELFADSLKARMIGGYDLSIDHSAMDQRLGTMVLGGVRISPRGGLETYSAALRHETDVVEAHVDTLAMDGFDLNRTLAHGGVSATFVHLVSGRVVILRDKTLPDGPSEEVPLLAEVIRRLPVGVGADTIQVDALDVLYRERADHSRGYAEVPFDRIHATITGARNDRQDSIAFIIEAQCNAFTDVPVSMELRSWVQDTTDRFELDAVIGSMPFASLNKVTGPLLDIRAVDGRIDSVLLHMEADNRRAHGLVELAYHDLDLSTGGRKRKETRNRISTLILNTLVKKDNRNSGGPRKGFFAFDRRRDRGVFNYMWSGLREGTKEILLPKSFTR